MLFDTPIPDGIVITGEVSRRGLVNLPDSWWNSTYLKAAEKLGAMKVVVDPCAKDALQSQKEQHPTEFDQLDIEVVEAVGLVSLVQAVFT